MNAPVTAPRRAALCGAAAKADNDLSGWLKGLITGEGNSPSQVIISGILSVIPGLGQAMDVRDIIKGVIAISSCPTSPMAWLDMTITLIGCIPVMGDGLKTGFRLMKSGQSLPRILDGMSPSIRGNLERWFKEINWVQISNSVKKTFDDVLEAFIEGLDTWIAKTLGGKQEIDFLIAQIRDLRRRAPTMLDNAIEELQAFWRRAMGDAKPRSTSSPGRAAPRPTPRAPATARATPNARARAPAPAQRPTPVKRDRTATSDTTPTNQPRSNERRASRKRDKFQSGVLGEHLTDYWVAKSRRNLKKANNAGRLWEEWDKAGRQGIDHVWVQSGNPARPGVIGETKSSLLGAFQFLASLPPDIKSQLMQLGDAEAANPTPQTQNSAKPVPNIFESEGRDNVTAKTRTGGTQQTEDGLKRGLGKPNPDTGLATQMSHKWIERNIKKEILTASGKNLIERIELYREDAVIDKKASPPYARWIVMITGRQKHLHEKKQGHKHEIQQPLISLPDNILRE